MLSLKQLAAISAVLLTGVRALEPPISGYGVEDFTWEIPTADGATESVTGTLQDVIAKLEIVNAELLVKMNESAVITPRAVDLEAAGFSKRDYQNCNNFPPANYFGIQDGITHLRSITSGQPTNGPGPGNCGRVSCSWGNAIWWCNDNPFPKTLPAWSTIANAAWLINENCPHEHYPEISGQRFHDDNWNVIVRNTPC